MGTRVSFQVEGHISFDEWILLNPEYREAEKKCDECKGTGYSECPHCGQDMDCKECDGSGKINSAVDAYRDQCFRDDYKVKKYMPGSLIAIVPLHNKKMVQTANPPRQLSLC